MEDVLEAVEMSHESLTRLLADAATDAVLVSGAMCIYRVLPILFWRAPSGLYEDVTRSGMWFPETLPNRMREVLEALREVIDPERSEDAPEEIGELYSMASEMVLRFFADGMELNDWSDWCSTLGLDIHQQFDSLLSEGNETTAAVFIPAGTIPDLSPLEGLEISDQISTLVRLGSSDPEVRHSVLEIAEQGNLRTRTALGQVTRFI
ncbi:hypothetical protein AB0I51_05005 [Streptomyces sp. NPDC050549]|uniref:hypothetical protein n=1 Tax=Streptomyces sp. NPDC050549 TaxID=3155406 RepID=UPI00341A1969